MAKLRDLERKPPKILLYGEPGSGKTALGLTLGERLEVIDLEQGLTTGLTLKDKFTESRMSVEAMQFVDKGPGSPSIFREAKAYLLKIANLSINKKYPHQAVMVDSLTSLADAAMRYVMDNSGKLNGNPEIQHWGLAFTEIENFLNIARAMPVVFILTAHVQVIEVDGVIEKQIDIPGRRLPSKVTRYFDEIWYAKTRNAPGNKREHILQTKSTASILCRTRNGLEDNTNMDLGLEEILRRLGYEFPTREPSAVPG